MTLPPAAWCGQGGGSISHRQPGAADRHIGTTFCGSSVSPLCVGEYRAWGGYLGVVNDPHGSEVVDTRVEADLIQDGDPSGLRRPVQRLHPVRGEPRGVKEPARLRRSVRCSRRVFASLVGDVAGGHHVLLVGDASLRDRCVEGCRRQADHQVVVRNRR